MFMIHLTWVATRPVDPFELAGDEHGPAVSVAGDRVSATITLDAASPGAALDAAIDHCLGRIAGELIGAELEAA